MQKHKKCTMKSIRIAYEYIYIIFSRRWGVQSRPHTFAGFELQRARIKKQMYECINKNEISLTSPIIQCVTFNLCLKRAISKLFTRAAYFGGVCSFFDPTQLYGRIRMTARGGKKTDMQTQTASMHIYIHINVLRWNIRPATL